MRYNELEMLEKILLRSIERFVTQSESSIVQREARDAINVAMDHLLFDRTPMLDTDLVNFISDNISSKSKEHKEGIIKLILTLIKDDTDKRKLSIIFSALRPYIPGPELDVIEKSLRADGIITEDEDDDYPVFEHALDILKYNVLNGIKFMINYDITLKDIPASRAIIEKKKPVILRALLKQIKIDAYGATVSDDVRTVVLQDVYDYINELIRIGIVWPELLAIEKSLRADGIIKEAEVVLL